MAVVYVDFCWFSVRFEGAINDELIRSELGHYVGLGSDVPDCTDKQAFGQSGIKAIN